MQTNENKGEMTLAALASHLGIEPSHIKRTVNAWRQRRPDLPFPEPVRRFQRFDTYDRDELMAWVDEVAPSKHRYFNAMAQRFIRGEFDRTALQQEYQMKRIRAKHGLRLRHAA